MRQTVLVGASLLSLAFLPNAQAADQAFCDSPWLVEGKQIEGEISQNTAAFSVDVLSVKRQDAQNCTAQLNVRLNTFAKLIIPAAGGQFTLNVSNNNAQLNGQLSTGQNATPFATSSVAVALKGLLFKPAQKVIAGQSVPARQYSANANADMFIAQGLPKMGEASINNASFSAGAAQVGAEQNLNTALGPMRCLPIQYQAKVSSGTVYESLSGRTKAPETKTLGVTEWYCPEQGLSMQTDFRYQNSSYTMRITSIR